MKTAREVWGLADRVAEAVRRGKAELDMNRYVHPCGSPSCLAGYVCAVGGVIADLHESPSKWATRELGLVGVHDAMHGLFGVYARGWDADLRQRYKDGDYREAAIEALYREIERAHGSRPPQEEVVYTVPDWKQVVREMELEEAGVMMCDSSS